MKYILQVYVLVFGLASCKDIVRNGENCFWSCLMQTDIVRNGKNCAVTALRVKRSKVGGSFCSVKSSWAQAIQGWRFIL